jgi:hypothetical protein
VPCGSPSASSATTRVPASLRQQQLPCTPPRMHFAFIILLYFNNLLRCIVIKIAKVAERINFLYFNQTSEAE